MQPGQYLTKRRSKFERRKLLMPDERHPENPGTTNSCTEAVEPLEQKVRKAEIKYRL